MVMRFVEDPGDPEEWIEGEPGEDGPVATAVGVVPCFLFLPLGGEEPQPRSRKVTRPQVMFDPAEVAGEVPGSDDELLIGAPELAAFFVQADGAPAGTGRWQIEGAPQPFGAPGERVIGALANLKAVAG